MFPPEPKTEPGLPGAVVDAFPPGPKTDPAAFVDALAPRLKTDPVFGEESKADPPNADPTAGCCTPNPEGCVNAEIVVPCMGAPKAGTAVGIFPNEDCPNTDPPDGADRLLDPNADD